MIVFTKIRWKNLLSYGNKFTEVLLNENSQTLLLGKNGCGKSTILDALTVGMFNKSFRRINKPQLVNTTNKKDCVIEIEFIKGEKHYMVRRGIKPAIFEIYISDTSDFQNAELLDQDSKSRDYQEHLEKNILGFNYKSFTQVVVLGSSNFIPFMQLNSANRRTIIEDIFDINIFSDMNIIVKQKLNELSREETTLNNTETLLAEKIELYEKYIEQVNESVSDKIELNNVAINMSKKDITTHLKDWSGIEEDILEHKSLIQDKDTTHDLHTKLINIKNQLQKNIIDAQNEINFYESHNTCPTCDHELESDFSETKIRERQESIAKFQTTLVELSAKLILVKDKIKKIEDIISKIRELESKAITHKSRIHTTKQYILKLEAENAKLLSKDESHENNEDIDKLNQESADLKEMKKTLSGNKALYDLAAGILKDSGIKSVIIKQYLTLINKMSNKYLNAMDFPINFKFDENFDEDICSQHRKTFSYMSFSEGEKQRIDLALLFTWREIARLKNSVNCNLLILDEIFDSSLDTSGTEAFLKIINTLPDYVNTFVITHKGEVVEDKFENIIKIDKVKNFSRIV